MKKRTTRYLIFILGDQLTLDNPALADFDPQQDRILTAEVKPESTKVWNHKARIALFLSAMRHFWETLQTKNWPVDYIKLDAPENDHTLASALTWAIKNHAPDKVRLCQPGEWEVQQNLTVACEKAGTPLEVLEDTHFLSSIESFKQYANQRKQLRMEFFYREMRRKYNILLEENGQPLGGSWNYDEENRQTFGKTGPPASLNSPLAFPPDAITQDVISLVERQFPDHPGNLDHFDWPVTPEQAEAALADFIENRLSLFGKYQDAMWQPDLLSNRPYLYHSRLSAAMNLKLISPLQVIQAAEQAYRDQKASLASVEGFIRQILGWREYVRGIYWLKMPEYVSLNALDAQEDLPAFYWTASTDMACLRHSLQQTLDYGYAHHIQRLMVTGLFALLYGVNPKQVHEWYLAVYVDAVEWVELPNTLGMSQFGDGGFMASKPYVATGKYIQRMSNYCQGCRYDPALSTGETACPFTTLYWDFLLRHEQKLSTNARMGLQLRNLQRLSSQEKQAIQQQALAFREKTAQA